MRWEILTRHQGGEQTPVASMSTASVKNDNHDIDTMASLQARIAQLERMLESRDSEIALAEYQIGRAYDYVSGLLDVVPSLLMTIDHQGLIRRANAEAQLLLGQELVGMPLRNLLPDYDDIIPPLLRDHDRGTIRRETVMKPANGDAMPILLSIGKQTIDVGDRATMVLSAVDLRERTRLEVELRHAQKLESIGQLSAGIAHEINTPMQFINDNLNFIAQSVNSLMTLISLAEDLLGKTLPSEQIRAELAREGAALDVAFIQQRLPRAISRALEGVGRVSHIVDGMRVFSHPSLDAEPVDLNALIANALTISRNEYKYVAELVFEPGNLPVVVAIRGDLGQVIINMITNAAHAITEQFKSSGERGLIRVSTTHIDESRHTQIIIEDNGTGIPDAIRHRIFDPFFTTKPVGQGTGQGLSICHSIVVDRHGGSMRVEQVSPHGTRFVITLPDHPPEKTDPRG